MGNEEVNNLFGRAKRIHLIGIGGIGVSGAARILLRKGFCVSGSDVRESSITMRLREEGAAITIGHSPENIKGADVVVYSTAIPKTNQELASAENSGLPVIHRSQLLAFLMSGEFSIGVTGTNGKGTVSAMITHILKSAGLDPSFFIGGMMNNYGTNASSGTSGVFVSEIDESDGSLLNTMPDYAVINNIEPDHLNYYRDFKTIISTIALFIENNKRLKKYFLNASDRGTSMLPDGILGGGVKFGLHPAGDYSGKITRYNGSSSSFELYRRGDLLGEIDLNLPGKFNALNAIGASAVCSEYGINFDRIAPALSSFTGLENRFTVIDAGRFKVVKDYISHPSGISGVIEAAREYKPGRIIAVFKPYRFTMIHYLQDEYREAFRHADLCVVTELYTAGEVPIPGIDSEFIVNKIGESGVRVKFVKEMSDIEHALRGEIKNNDMLIFFGGDDLFAVADDFALKLRRGELFK
ncbi:MAG: UDP-N-acetylmuramate--L-alanine ligase [Deltaproteobacteria bacterium]|nr:UDP-N-acetylmuramate--L-alanine ligase [Deltaproteobacteria bacterium]